MAPLNMTTPTCDFLDDADFETWRPFLDARVEFGLCLEAMGVELDAAQAGNMDNHQMQVAHFNLTRAWINFDNHAIATQRLVTKFKRDFLLKLNIIVACKERIIRQVQDIEDLKQKTRQQINEKVWQIQKLQREKAALQREIDLLQEEIGTQYEPIANNMEADRRKEAARRSRSC